MAIEPARERMITSLTVRILASAGGAWVIQRPPGHLVVSPGSTSPAESRSHGSSLWIAKGNSVLIPGATAAKVHVVLN
jgi:hypothetical protein